MTHTELAGSSATGIVPEPIFRLIYRSRSKVPPSDLERELGNILRVARTKNTTLGITGALLVYDNWFAQTLEGPEDAVRALYARIEKDARHDSVELKAEGMVASRVFSRWAMAMVAEHGDPDIPLIATASGVSHGAPRRSTEDQERVLDIMRDATRGYGRGS